MSPSSTTVWSLRRTLCLLIVSLNGVLINCQVSGNNATRNKINCEVLYDDLGFELRWVMDGDDIVMQLAGRVDPGEYMAFGLGKDDHKSDMINTDAVVAWIDDKTKKGFAVDYFLGAKHECNEDKGVCPDVKASKCASDSITLLHSSFVNGFSMVTFMRPQLGVDDTLDQHVYSDGLQSINWAIGPLNEKKEVSFHRIHSIGNSFIDFARTPKWNCPAPDGPLPEGVSPATDSAVPSTAATTPSSVPVRTNLLAPPTLSLPPASGSLATSSSESNIQPWEIPSIICPADVTFRAQIGPTGGRKGYQAITGNVGWGIAWYINGLLIPELVVQRGKTYTFIIEGGNDPAHSSRRHPFYITDNPEGGYAYRTDEERAQQKIFAGAGIRSDGQIIPTAEGRLCEWKPTDIKSNPDSFADFFAFQRSLNLQCVPGKSAVIQWTPDANTPDTVFYQCWTHRLLGWKIRVVDSCENIAAAASSLRVRTSSSSNSRRNHHQSNARISSSEQMLPQYHHASMDLMRMNHNHRRPQVQQTSPHSPVPAGSVVKAVTASSPSSASTPSPSSFAVTSASISVLPASSSPKIMPHASSSNVRTSTNNNLHQHRKKNNNNNHGNNRNNIFSNPIHFNIQPQLESHWMFATHSGSSYEPLLPPPPPPLHHHLQPNPSTHPVMTFEPFFLPSYPLPPLLDDHPPVYIRQKLPPPIPLPKDQPLPTRPSHLSSLTHAHLKVNRDRDAPVSDQKEVVTGNEREGGRGNFLGRQPLYGGFVPINMNSKPASSMKQQTSSLNHSRIKHNKPDKNILNVTHTNTNNNVNNHNRNQGNPSGEDVMNNYRIHATVTSPSLPSSSSSDSNTLTDTPRYNISRFGYPSYTTRGTFSPNRISSPSSTNSSSSSFPPKIKKTSSIDKMKNLPPVPYQRPLDPSYSSSSSVSASRDPSLTDSMIAMERDSKMSSSVARPTHSDEDAVFGSRPSSTRFSSLRHKKKSSSSSTTETISPTSSSFPSSRFYYNTENHVEVSSTSPSSSSSSTPSYSSPTTAKTFASYSFSSPSTSYSYMTTPSTSPVSASSPSLSNGVNDMPSSTTEKEVSKNKSKNKSPSSLRVKAIEIPSTSSFYSPESTSPSSVFPSSYSYSSPSSSPSSHTSSSSSYYSSYTSPSLLSSSIFDASSSSSSSSSSFSFPTTLSDSPAFSSSLKNTKEPSSSSPGNDNAGNSLSSSLPLTTVSFMTTTLNSMKSNNNRNILDKNNSNGNNDRHQRYHNNQATAGGAILEVIDDDILTTTMPTTTTTTTSSPLYSSPVTPDPDLKHHQGYGSSSSSTANKTESFPSVQDMGISYNPIYYDGGHPINLSSTDHTILNHILSLIAVGESPPEVKVFTKPSRDSMQGAFSTHVEVHQKLPSSSSTSFSRSKRSPHDDHDGHNHDNDELHVLRQQQNRRTSSSSSSNVSPSSLSLIILFITFILSSCNSSH